MFVKFLIAAHLFFGLSIGLQESDLNCGGDIVITIDEVGFRKEPVNPVKTICVNNATSVTLAISDTDGETVLATYLVEPWGEQFIPADSSLTYREIISEQAE